MYLTELKLLKPKQLKPEIEIEDNIIIDDGDLDLIDYRDIQKYIIITVI